MTYRDRNPKTFQWEHTEQRGKTYSLGPDGFLDIPEREPPELTWEVTLRFEGEELKGYSVVHDVDIKSAPEEIFLDVCS